MLKGSIPNLYSEGFEPHFFFYVIFLRNVNLERVLTFLFTLDVIKFGLQE